VTALVERWRPKTLTLFIFLFENAQLDIRVDDRPVTGATYYDWEEMCEQYLGVVQPKGESIVGFAIKLKWLQENMSLLLAKPIQQKLETHCRAYILQLIGGVLMPDKMRNCVHLMYFIVLADLE